MKQALELACGAGSRMFIGPLLALRTRLAFSPLVFGAASGED
jgi:hypothetical protein